MNFDINLVKLFIDYFLYTYTYIYIFNFELKELYKNLENPEEI